MWNVKNLYYGMEILDFAAVAIVSACVISVTVKHSKSLQDEMDSVEKALDAERRFTIIAIIVGSVSFITRSICHFSGI